MADGPPASAERARHRARRTASTFWLHLHPPAVPRHAVRLGFTLGAGGITFFLFLLTAATGALLMLHYRPTPEHAYLDLKDLENVVPFGPLVRNLHRGAAHAMVLAASVHLARVFLTGAYKPPRQRNWAIGVGLLVTTMLTSFTGYLLPWDQKSLWAITVGTNMVAAVPLLGHQGPLSELVGVTAETDLRAVLLGGTSVSGLTLLRFYVAHCVLLPAILCLGMALHFWRVRKDGGISGPAADETRSADR
jgi:quinol-cytochrome oxidoreductase complex cytochrome b subunit